MDDEEIIYADTRACITRFYLFFNQLVTLSGLIGIISVCTTGYVLVSAFM
ncbi:hypothetical protein [Xenorhabdus doucetiae]|nr:hypothetical protein [Xenorhabdus sp. 3]